MYKNLLIFLATLTLSTGCASITRGTTDAFSIETNPPGAEATLSNGLTCTTPCAMELPRKDGFSVKIEKEGYQTVEANVIPKQASGGSAGMAGNILLGGLIGAAIDSSSGAMKDLYPNPLVVELQAVGAPTTSAVLYPDGEKIEAIPEDIVVEEAVSEAVESEADVVTP